ncbi:dual specificity protein phosphatase [Acanthamoeba castellanii str. Neff]|uniref:Dual specificity protein phosphatase n=1 Tax=Acanthamoeba castellanii (strain ATCC 30010 / Neff) TaxID=1257118 RepID=L8H9U5_ACACF|nr:dual specificity protein phosphatase [Acanthamoeba castellanii str. Neff]ELR21186.1 dual specificity protein phosphatase [Acanthamoeba castellanii str. Neff]
MSTTSATKKILTSDSHPLKVDYVADLPTQGKLGMTFAPGKFQENTPTGNVWHRDVATDVRVLRETHGTDVLVSLLEDFEYSHMQIEHLFATCREHGIEVIHYPIVDGETPVSLEDTHAVVSKMQAHLEAGRNVVVHCKAGLGRTGLITGCCLKALGVSGEEALERVQLARNGTCYQTNQQHYLLHSFLPAVPADRQNA